MLTLPLLIAFIILQNTAKATDLSKTVCTITINSSEEQETFKKYLKPQGFKFVELIPSNDEVDSKVNWFAKACKRVKENGIHCDALVVSGHFGGIFFDSNRINPSLSLEDMEAQSCSASCEGVLNDPKAVYLFGCNTLAGKEKDIRTPEQYLQVLLQDGIPRAQAEMVVESRYGAIGDTNRDRMTRIFWNSARIYGFNSIGPSGTVVKKYLEDFFNQTPNYSKYLADLEKERFNRNVTKQLQEFNANNNKANDKFQCCLKVTSVCCASGICEQDKVASQLLCSLRDPNKTSNEKLFEISALLKRKDYLAFIPTAVQAIKNIEVDKLSPDVKMAWKDIQDNQEVKKSLVTLISKSSLIEQRINWVEFAQRLSWLSEDEAVAQYFDIIKNLLAKFENDQDTRDLFLSLMDRDNFRKTIQNYFLELSPYFVKLLKSDRSDVRSGVFNIITFYDKEIPSEIKRQISLLLNNKEICYQAVVYVFKGKVSDPELRSKAIAQLKNLLDFSPANVFTAEILEIAISEYKLSKDPDLKQMIEQKLVKSLNSIGSINFKDAYRVIDINKLVFNSQEIQLKLVSIVEELQYDQRHYPNINQVKRDEAVLSLVSCLIRSQATYPEILVKLSALLDSKNSAIRKRVFSFVSQHYTDNVSDMDANYMLRLNLNKYRTSPNFLTDTR